MGGGIVYLVGAGPGDPGLMPRRSLELITAADVILYDRLVPPGALDGAREGAEVKHEVVYCVDSVCTDRNHDITMAGEHF